MKEKIISKEEIMEILTKYNIGKKPLSLVLGWGEITIIRYLDGQLPDKFHSDILYKIKEEPMEFSKYIEKNKDLITTIAYKKVIGKMKEMKLEEDKSKIYLVAKHIIAKMGDTTPLALQKILYYIDGFSLALLGKELLDSPCEAWIHGPVYREIYERFSYYAYHSIENENFQEYKTLKILEKEEIELMDEVIECFGCYSGKILEKMTHQTMPWQKAREGLDETMSSQNQIEPEDMSSFFKKVCQDYQITSPKDISKYSRKMFKKVVR